MLLPAVVLVPPATAEMPSNENAVFYAQWRMDKDRNGIDDALDADLADGATGPVLLHVHYGVRPTEADAALLRDAYGADRTYVFRNWDDVKVETTYDRVAGMRTAPGVVAVEKFVPPSIELDIATKGTRARQAAGVPVVDGIDHLLAVHESLGYRGEGMVIAVLDTGVDNLHESLDDLDDDPATDDPKRVERIDPVTGLRVPAAADVEDGFNVLECIDPLDNGAHGTHVAGIALGTGGPSHEFQGVAPQARLVEVDIAPVAIGIGMDLGFDWVMSFNRGETCYGDPGEDRIDVVTLSFGMAGGDNPEASTQRKYTDVVRSGMTSIVSAGNSGSGASTLTKGPEGLIVVADVDDANTVVRSDDAVSSTSSRGPRVSSDGDADPLDNLMPHVGAPGTDILSAAAGTLGQYVGLSGTSMAAPHIAGVAALILQANPGLRPQNLEHDAMGDAGAVPVRDVLIKAAQHKTAAQGGDPQAAQTGRFGLPWNNAWGYGLVDAYAAVQVALDPDQLFVGAGSTYTCVVGEPCELRAEASGGTPPYVFSWTTGDGGSASGAVVLHTYAAEGDFTATATVTDAAGASRSASALVQAREADDLGIVGALARSWSFDGAEGCDAQGWISRSGRFVSVGTAKQYASTGGTQWHLQEQSPASAPCAWYHGLDATRTYTDLSVTQLDSPAGAGCLFLPPGTSGATLTFNLAGMTERNFDQLLVMYQPGPCIPGTPDNFLSSAATFVELALLQGAVGDLHADPPLYEEVVVPLTPLVAGGNGLFQLRFRFYSDIAVSEEGFQIDDVRLYAANGAPALSAPADVTAFTTDDVAFTVAASDPDGDPVTMTASDVPDGATFDAATGAFAWSPGDEQEGIATVTFTASDGLWTTTEDVVITVLNVPPVAAGTASLDETDRLTAVQFADASTDADGTIASWLWDFGDGTTSAEQHPAHTYTALGTKKVTLTVTDDDGATDMTEVGRIKVKNIPPKAKAGGPDGGGAGGVGAQSEGADFTANRAEPLSLTDRSEDRDGSVVEWHWAWGDGATSDAQHPSHQYTQLGTFTVAQTATDNDGDAGASSYRVEVVNLLPAADFAHDPVHPIALVPVQFEDLSADRDGQIAAWAWDFGDGFTSEARDPVHVFVSEGWHRVTLRVTDNDGGASEVARDVYVCMPGVRVEGLVDPAHQHLEVEGCIALGGDLPV